MLTRPRVRAVVLAAGRGARLAPLTAERPKPLLPVLGRPLLAGTLERLEAFGVEATAINLHHRAEAIPAALGERFGAMPLHYSREAEILGTLGALHPLRDFLTAADLVLLVNGDSLCRWPFAELVAHHLETAPLATLLLTTRADVGELGGIAIDEAGRIVGVPGGPDHGHVAARRVFAGAHVFAPALALEAPPRFSDSIRDLYRPRLASGARLESFSTAAPWHDLGTAARYLEAVLDWAELAEREESTASRTPPGVSAATGDSPARASWISPTATIAPDARLERAVVESRAVVEAGVSGRDILVLEGARVGGGSRLARVVVGPGVELASATRLESAVVTQRAWGLAAGSRGEGSLVVTPFAAAGARSAP
ncbi:MAG TPA: NDP-sugar synthase [Thermoanaerobaculia bacterium]|nr:NDP-sugar synthase [Thermoanaerobaculia bacterium]